MIVFTCIICFTIGGLFGAFAMALCNAAHEDSRCVRCWYNDGPEQER